MMKRSLTRNVSGPPPSSPPWWKRIRSSSTGAGWQSHRGTTESPAVSQWDYPPDLRLSGCSQNVSVQSGIWMINSQFKRIFPI